MGSKMKVVCEHCSAEHQLDETEMTGRGVRITCPACSHVFVVYQEDVQLEGSITERTGPDSTNGLEIDFEIELDENGEFSMDLDDMLSSIVSEVDTDTGDGALNVDMSDASDSAPNDNDVAQKKQDDEEHGGDTESFFNKISMTQPTTPVDEVQVSAEVLSNGDTPNSSDASQSTTDVDNGESTPITQEQVNALDVHALNFASVGIKSWKVKKSIGLMFEYSDFKTFQKSLQDGRISSADQLSPDGKTWVSMADISNYEQYFCRTYLEFESKGFVEEVKAVKEKVIQHVGGTNELASALAAAQAEVEQANSPSSTSRNMSRKQSRPSRSKKRPTSTNKTPEKSSGGLLLNLLVGIAVLGGGFFFFSGSDEPTEVPQQQVNTQAKQQGQPNKNEVDDASLRALREELQASAAKIQAEQEPEPEPSTEEEPQLIAKVPEEILAQQRAMATGQNTLVVKKPTADPAVEGQKALRSQQWQKAIEQFQLAYKKTQNPEFLSSIGFAQFKSGQFGQAKKSLQSAIKKGSVSANKWLGYLLREEGDIAGSNQYLNQYLQTNPVDATEVKRRMME